jgi:Bifunctional DNA primase/polymerase, N-terminal
VSAGPYADAFRRYRELGWRGTLPIGLDVGDDGVSDWRPGRKKRPPAGYTGAAGLFPDDELAARWARDERGACNIGLRLPDDLLGLDVDQYGDKRGLDRLREFRRVHGLGRLGLLDTVRSSARPAPSGIYLFRVPAGCRWVGEACPDVEVVQHAHRYAVVWPSVHPTGAGYAWWNGAAIDPPSIADERFRPLPGDWCGKLVAPSEIPADNPPAVEHRETYWSAAVDHTCRRALDALDGPGSAHEATRSSVMVLCRLESDGEPGATAALDRLAERFTATVTDRARAGDVRTAHEAAAEWRRMVEGGRERARTTERPRSVVTGPARPAAGAVATSAGEDGRLPDTFWTARAELDRIRRAAFARGRAPDAVLHVVLARLAAAVPWTLRLPGKIGSHKPLCYFGNIIGPPGAGKGDALAIAAELVPLPPWVLDVPPGSGEGLAELLYGEVNEIDPDTGKSHKVRRIVRHNAFLPLDEGRVLADVGARKGSTLVPALCSIWTGNAIGQGNADAQRYRNVPAGTYTYGLVCLFQTTTIGPLFAEIGAGLPQRFGWAHALDPAIPAPDDRPDWPGPLDWTPPPVITNGEHVLALDAGVVAEVARADHERATGAVALDPSTRTSGCTG